MTAIQQLIEIIKQKRKQSDISNTMLRFAQVEAEKLLEVEKEQCQNIWDSAQYDMRKQFRSSAYKGMTFEQWFEQSSKIDNV